MSAKRYRVLSRVRHDGVVYAPDAVIEIEDHIAAPLLEAGAIDGARPDPDPDPDRDDPPALPTPPTVEAALDTAFEALHQATPDQVREFVRSIADSPDLAAACGGLATPEDAIAAACQALRRGRDKASWTASGVPTVEAVESLIGLDVSAAERDAAWTAAEEGSQ